MAQDVLRLPSIYDRGAMHENTSPDGELDVRVIEPRFKHSTIYDRLDKLGPGQSLVIVNDHDPRPLRYQLDAEHPDAFQWLYLEEGPETWRVEIKKYR